MSSSASVSSSVFSRLSRETTTTLFLFSLLHYSIQLSSTHLFFMILRFCAFPPPFFLFFDASFFFFFSDSKHRFLFFLLFYGRSSTAMMDYCNQMKSTDEIVRRPLVPFEKTNASSAPHSSIVPNIRKLRTREVVGSRYSSTTGMGTGAGTGTTGMVGGNGNVSAGGKRHPSPVSSRTGLGTAASMIAMPKRAQSVERKRPGATTSLMRSSAPSSPSAKTPASSRGLSPSRHSATTTQGIHDSLVSAAARLPVSSQRSTEVLWPSMRSMSSAFQSEIISIPISKKESKSSSSSSLNFVTERERKRTSLPGRSSSTSNDHLENNTHHNHKPNATVVDQHRWPRTTTNGPKIAAGTTTPFPSRVGFSSRLATPINISRSDSETTLSLARSSRTMSLPSSPSKALSPTSSSGKRMGSPFRTRPSTPFSPTSPSSSSYSNISDNYRRLKKSPNHIEDAHQLRISHVRHLQWRFMNARAEDFSSFQKLAMEDELYSTWINITDLHNSVSSLKIQIQNLKQEMKLNSILEEQMAYLHDYSSLSENIHVNSLNSAITALQASTMRLPLTGKITVTTSIHLSSIPIS